MRTRNQMLRVPLSIDRVSRPGGVHGPDEGVVDDDAGVVVGSGVLELLLLRLGDRGAGGAGWRGGEAGRGRAGLGQGEGGGKEDEEGEDEREEGHFGGGVVGVGR
jgi:hypothetical protein